MSRWFRVYDDLVDDEKVQMLSGDLVKALLNLWCLASKNGGVLPPMKAMAFKLRMKPPQVAAVITELCEAGLIDRVDDLFQPHNWDKRQYKSDTDATAAERSRRYRAKHRDSNEPVTRDGDASRHASDSVSVSVSVSASSKKEEKSEISLSSGFDDFWKIWPNKVGKPVALKAYKAAIKRGAAHQDIVAGVWRYIADKPPDRDWLNPSTFLNQNRWEDQPAKVEANGYRSTNSRTTGHDAILAAATREARKIVGDGDMAGPADEVEFSIGPGPDGGTARGRQGSFGTTAAGDDGRKSFGVPVVEGEVIAPDQTDAGLPRGWRVVG
jgi:hypothetical protein